MCPLAQFAARIVQAGFVWQLAQSYTTVGENRDASLDVAAAAAGSCSVLPCWACPLQLTRQQNRSMSTAPSQHKPGSILHVACPECCVCFSRDCRDVPSCEWLGSHDSGEFAVLPHDQAELGLMQGLTSALTAEWLVRLGCCAVADPGGARRGPREHH